MKVYVCYHHIDYEGCSQPKYVFSNKQKAEQWVKDEKWNSWSSRRYIELEVDK